MIPIYDDNPALGKPILVLGIIVLCVIIWFWQSGLGYQANNQMIISYGLTPAAFLGKMEQAGPLISIFTLFTSMFMHGGFLHIIGNMWFLYIFGDNIESILGHIRYFFFYLFCGLFASILQFFFDPLSTIPMIGASGAISGILGAYLIKFPKARIHVLAVFFIFITTIVVPAQLVLGIWFLIQLSQGINSIGINTSGGVAWFAHIGGFIGGIGSLKIFQTFKIKNI